MPSGRQEERLLGETDGPVAEQDTDGQVLVDHQHDGAASGVVVGVVAAEEGVVLQVGVQRGLKLVGEIAPGDPPPYLAIGLGDARIARASATTPFLEELLADGHGFHSAIRSRGAAYRSRRAAREAATPTWPCSISWA